MKSIRYLAMAAIVCALALTARAQTVTVNATQLYDGAAPANGTIYFAPALSTGTAASYHRPGGGTASVTPVSAPVTNGAFTLTLPDTSLTSPTNICFSASLVTGSGQVLGAGYSCMQPTANNSWCASGICNFDNYVPATSPQPTINYVPTINGVAGPWTMTGAGASCNGSTLTCTFGGGMVWPSGVGVAGSGGGSSWGTTYNASNQIPAAWVNLSPYTPTAGLGGISDPLGSAAAAQAAAEAASDPLGSAASAQAASLQKANNLSDLASPTTAVTNLGLMPPLGAGTNLATIAVWANGALPVEQTDGSFTYRLLSHATAGSADQVVMTGLTATTPGGCPPVNNSWGYTTDYTVSAIFLGEVYTSCTINPLYSTFDQRADRAAWLNGLSGTATTDSTGTIFSFSSGNQVAGELVGDNVEIGTKTGIGGTQAQVTNIGGNGTPAVITAVSVTGNVATITAANAYFVSEPVIFTGISGIVSTVNLAGLNGANVIATASGTQFTVPFNDGNVTIATTPQIWAAANGAAISITSASIAGSGNSNASIATIVAQNQYVAGVQTVLSGITGAGLTALDGTYTVYQASSNGQSFTVLISNSGATVSAVAQSGAYSTPTIPANSFQVSSSFTANTSYSWSSPQLVYTHQANMGGEAYALFTTGPIYLGDSNGNRFDMPAPAGATITPLAGSWNGTQSQAPVVKYWPDSSFGAEDAQFGSGFAVLLETEAVDQNIYACSDESAVGATTSYDSLWGMTCYQPSGLLTSGYQFITGSSDGGRHENLEAETYATQQCSYTSSGTAITLSGCSKAYPVPVQGTLVQLTDTNGNQAPFVVAPVTTAVPAWTSGAFSVTSTTSLANSNHYASTLATSGTMNWGTTGFDLQSCCHVPYKNLQCDSNNTGGPCFNVGSTTGTEFSIEGLSCNHQLPGFPCWYSNSPNIDIQVWNYYLEQSGLNSNPTPTVINGDSNIQWMGAGVESATGGPTPPVWTATSFQQLATTKGGRMSVSSFDFNHGIAAYPNACAFNDLNQNGNQCTPTDQFGHRGRVVMGSPIVETDTPVSVAAKAQVSALFHGTEHLATTACSGAYAPTAGINECSGSAAVTSMATTNLPIRDVGVTMNVYTNSNIMTFASYVAPTTVSNYGIVASGWAANVAGTSETMTSGWQTVTSTVSVQNGSANVSCTGGSSCSLLLANQMVEIAGTTWCAISSSTPTSAGFALAASGSCAGGYPGSTASGVAVVGTWATTVASLGAQANVAFAAVPSDETDVEFSIAFDAAPNFTATNNIMSAVQGVKGTFVKWHYYPMNSACSTPTNGFVGCFWPEQNIPLALTVSTLTITSSCSGCPGTGPPTATYWNNGVISGAIPFTANTAKAYAIDYKTAVQAANFGYDVTTIDNTSNLYNLGIYNNIAGVCTLVAHIGPTAGTSFTGAATGEKTQPFAEGTVTFPAGRYYFVTDSVVATAQLGGVATQQLPVANATVGTTSGAVLPGTITCPTDTWAISAEPNIAIR
jgi:hypothetical protein